MITFVINGKQAVQHLGVPYKWRWVSGLPLGVSRNIITARMTGALHEAMYTVVVLFRLLVARKMDSGMENMTNRIAHHSGRGGNRLAKYWSSGGQ